METVSVDEGVRVGAAFDKCKVMPIWFLWRGRYYRVRSVTYTWSTDQGSARLHHYSVTDGANLYELQFNAGTLEWVLGKVCAG